MYLVRKVNRTGCFKKSKHYLEHCNLENITGMFLCLSAMLVSLFVSGFSLICDGLNFFFFFLPWQPHYGDFRARELYIYLDQHEEVWASLTEEGGWIAYGTHHTRGGTSLPGATGSCVLPTRAASFLLEILSCWLFFLSQGKNIQTDGFRETLHL